MKELQIKSPTHQRLQDASAFEESRPDVWAPMQWSIACVWVFAWAALCVDEYGISVKD